MAASRRSRVCLFGLSADPPTGESGHVGIVRALAANRDMDEVRVLPVFRHTFRVRHECRVCTNRLSRRVTQQYFILHCLIEQKGSVGFLRTSLCHVPTGIW